MVAPEGWTVDLSILAEDDVRVARLDVSLLVSDKVGVRPVALSAERANPRRADAAYSLDLAAIGAVAGDRVRYFATAVDNHPSPPQSADSETGTIQVISREAYDEMMRQHYSMEDWLEEVSETLGTLHRLRDEKAAVLDQLKELRARAEADPAADLSREHEAAQKRLARLREDFDAFTGALLQRADLDSLYDWEAPYKDWLRETASDMREQQAAAAEVAKTLSPDTHPALGDAMNTWAFLIDPFGDLPADPMDLEEDWEEMMESLRMVEQVTRLQQLIEAQQDLAGRLAAVRERPDSPETQEMLRRLSLAQSELREELGSIQKGLRDSADALGEDQADLARQGRQLADALDRLKVSEDQAEAAKQAGAARADPAEAAARRAADSLASLAGDCAAQCEAGGQCLASLLGLTPPTLHPAMEAAMRAALTARPGLSLGKMGRQGAGSGGMMSTVGMIGPQYPVRGQSVSLRGANRPGRGEDGGGASGTDSASGQAQGIHPDELPESAPRAPGLLTIPQRYRRQAAAYFDRLVRDESEE